MPLSESDDVTRLMDDAAVGRAGAADALLPLVYDQLRRIAQQRMATERANHTLEATALVHEAYLRLVGPRELPWANRAHFYAAAAEAMRRILIDHARARHGRTPGGRDARAAALAIRQLDAAVQQENLEGLLALDDALCRLVAVDAQAAAVVRLRFYAGLDIESVAAALNVSARTVKRKWTLARGWLRHELEQGDAS